MTLKEIEKSGVRYFLNNYKVNKIIRLLFETITADTSILRKNPLWDNCWLFDLIDVFHFSVDVIIFDQKKSFYNWNIYYCQHIFDFSLHFIHHISVRWMISIEISTIRLEALITDVIFKSLVIMIKIGRFVILIWRSYESRRAKFIDKIWE